MWSLRIYAWTLGLHLDESKQVRADFNLLRLGLSQQMETEAQPSGPGLGAHKSRNECGLPTNKQMCISSSEYQGGAGD